MAEPVRLGLVLEGEAAKEFTADIIRNYVEKQGTKEEKDAYKQMNLLEFE